MNKSVQFPSGFKLGRLEPLLPFNEPLLPLGKAHDQTGQLADDIGEFLQVLFDPVDAGISVIGHWRLSVRYYTWREREALALSVRGFIPETHYTR